MSDLHFVEVDAARMIAEAKEALEREIGERLLPGDERLLVLLHVLEHIVGTYALIDQVGKSNLLRYAADEVLDALGQRVATERIQAQPAETTLRFTLAEAQQVAVTLPAGTRVTPDGEVFFATIQALVLPAGATQGEVAARALLRDGEDGARHNGYAIGAIHALVDRQLFELAVTNLDVSHGGVDREEDDAYRERIRLAPTSFSVAGPRDAYVYHALSAHSAVLDAEALQVAPGEVEVRLLLREAVDDPAWVAQTVLDHLNDRTIRPLTDRVTVQEAEAVAYDVDIVYAVTPIQETAVVRAVEGDGGALEQYRLWQDLAMGRDIDPDKLRALLFAAGAQRVTLTQPAFTAIAGHQRARRGALRVTHEVMNR